VADPTVNDTLVDEFIRHQVYLERLKAGQVLDLQQFLQALQDDVSAVLGKRLSDVTTQGTVNTQRLQQLLQEIKAISDDVAKNLQAAVVEQGKQLAAYESGWTLTTFQSVMPVTVDFNTVSPTLLWAAVNARPFEGRHLSQWFKDYTVNQQQKIVGAVRMSVIEGETIDQTIRRLRGTRAGGYRDGVVQGLVRRSAEALARTSIGHITQMARQATFEANSDVLQGLKWHSVLDSRTSLICISRDGKVYALDQGPRPPAHPNCRSSMVPVVKSWQALGLDLKEAPPGTRASLNGQVPATLTYAEWLKRQPATFQDDVLGKTRGDLFRSGKLTVDQFVDANTGRGYTLAELQAKHPNAFA
jgi:SPP1 gp7 family putative phage head morphogenesis protein